jgi:hypothetical protein
MSPEPAITINIVPASGRLHTLVANAEITFHTGPLANLKLCGFALWRSKYGGLTVSPPTQNYSAANGEQRRYKLLRPAVDGRSGDAALDSLCRRVLDAYKQRGANGVPVAVPGFVPGARAESAI